MTEEEEERCYLAEFYRATGGMSAALGLLTTLKELETPELSRQRLWDDALLLMLVTTADRVVSVLKWRYSLA